MRARAAAGGHAAQIGRLGLAPSRSPLAAALLLAAGLAGISLAARWRAADAAAGAAAARRALTPELLATWRATLAPAAEARARAGPAARRGSSSAPCSNVCTCIAACAHSHTAQSAHLRSDTPVHTPARAQHAPGSFIAPLAASPAPA